MDNESGGTGIIIFGVGILVGAFTAFLILKGREQQAPAVAAQQPYILAVPGSQDIRNEPQIMAPRVTPLEGVSTCALRGIGVRGVENPQGFGIDERRFALNTGSAEVQYLYGELQRLRIENDELRLKLQIAAPKGPVVAEPEPQPAAPHSQFLEAPNNNSDRINRMDRINSTTNPVNPVHPVLTAPAQVHTYKNTEKWKYEKDKLGRITGLEISREAKRNV